MKILNEFKAIINKSTKIQKDKGREIQTQRFLRGSADLAYVHAFNHTELEDSRTLTIDFLGVNQYLH